MDKPKGRVYWTAKHVKHDEAGVLVVGRIVIPMIIVYLTALVGAGVLAVYGVIASPKGEKMRIVEWSGFIPLAWYVAIVFGIFVLVSAGIFISWIAKTIREAQSGLDKRRWDY